MIWALIVYLVGYPPLEYPLFSDAAKCVEARQELLAQSPELVIACSPAGVRV